MGRIVGGAGPYSCCRVAASQAVESSTGCLPLRPRLTTPRRCTAPLRLLTWEDEKEHQMFLVLLTLCVSVALCVCVCVCMCMYCLSVLHYIFSRVQAAVDYLLLFHSPFCVPKCLDYVRNAAPPPNMLFICLEHHLVWLFCRAWSKFFRFLLGLCITSWPIIS